MRIGIRLGPFYASTNTRQRGRSRSTESSGGGNLIGWLFGVILLLGWPLALKSAMGGWAWVIAGVWWGLMALILLVAFIGWLSETPDTKKDAGQSGHQASRKQPGHSAPGQSSHPGPAEVRDMLIAVVETAVDKSRESNDTSAELLASVLKQMRELRASDAQFVRLAQLIPDAGSIPQLVATAGGRHSLHTESARAVLDSVIALAEGKKS